MFGLHDAKLEMPTAQTALPGRVEQIPVPAEHFVLGTPLLPPFAQHLEMAQFGMGCFWGAERKFWQTEGVFTTAVGYSGGFTQNPTYEEVCSGGTGHTEAVLVVYDPSKVTFAELLKVFWEGHDPTQGMRQGNDIGTQYRSTLYTYTEDQAEQASMSVSTYQQALVQAGYGEITTEVLQQAPHFYYAEHYHQQYLAKVPNGYCGLGGTGVGCDIAPLTEYQN